MAKGNLFMGYATGKVGSVVLSRLGGVQVSRAYNARPANPQTVNQQTQRTKLANLVNFYLSGERLLNHSFTRRKENQSSYNAFIAANMAANTIHLTKEEAVNKASVVFPYVISDGSLQTINVSGSNANATTSISLGADFAISEDTTIGALSTAILNNNSDWLEGDQLTYVSVEQKIDPNTNAPFAVFRYYELDINTSSNETVRSIMPEYALVVVGGKLAHGYETAEAGFTWVHSRKSSNGLICSRQKLVVKLTPVLAKYADAEQLQKALVSYNAQPDYLLTPDGNSTSDILEQLPVINSVKFNDTEITDATKGFPIPLAANSNFHVYIGGDKLEVIDGKQPMDYVTVLWEPASGTSLLFETTEVAVGEEGTLDVSLTTPRPTTSNEKGKLTIDYIDANGYTASKFYVWS